ncbi:MAG: thioredoxin domain-containing protein [Bacteroidetes bacterium]|nr:thioredoxin domain-containing protein [Bacteroidota bacterium]
MANRLQFESSPYLLQHSKNPVDWYPYGDEAFELAKTQNKPLLISIGYSACHWCHVMEHESFEDEIIAATMNELFICVKVDREERPDVDHFYMDAVQLLYGHGGWPLNCFTLPDGRPFWGGTYFRPDQWKEILQNVSELYSTQYQEFEEQAVEVTSGIIRHSAIVADSGSRRLNDDFFTEFFYNQREQFDYEYGGFLGSPKFPMPMILQAFLHYNHMFGQKEDLDHVLFTLKKMEMGGIYDQVGGGFARYSVDNKWKVPHFEKMLYDNAQLVSLYCNAFKVTKEGFLKETVEDILEFVNRELTSPEGVFYSSLDADSDGEEGLFYTWTREEFDDVLGPYAELMGEYFGVGEEGTWEKGRNILLRTVENSSFAQNHFLSEEELSALLKACRLSLLEVRARRNRPSMDDKVLLSWNSLMIKAYLDAFITFGNDEYLSSAVNAVNFLLKELKNPDGGYFHTWKEGVARIPAFLDDYSFLGEALVSLYQLTMDDRWLYESELIIRHILLHFNDTESGMFYFSEESHHNIVRKVETYDSVIPSSNSSVARLLNSVGTLTGNVLYCEISQNMMEKMNLRMVQQPGASANWACVAMETGLSHHVIAVVGEEMKRFISELSRYFLPNTLMIGSEGPSDIPYVKGRFVPGTTLIHICTENACFAPVDSVAKALQLLGAHLSILS